MPWRGDFVKAFWLDPDHTGLSGYPGQEEASERPHPDRAHAQGALSGREPQRPGLEGVRRVQARNTTYLAREWPQAPIGQAVITIRDRIGFEYERTLGLDDFVSVRDAAQLLSIPVMTVNRWVRAKKVKSSKRRGFAVIPLREVLCMAQEKRGKLVLGSRLKIIG